MLENLVTDEYDFFRKPQAVRDDIEILCRENGDAARFITLGESEEGREIYGTVLGRGSRKASLIGGSHADEPVGPETLRTFITRGIEEKRRLNELFEEWTFFVIPQVNPDGENRNTSWRESWPSLKDYLELVEREPPGRDIEYGPFHLHISFHGMGFSEGVLLLIERHWIDHTGDLREAFAQSAEKNKLSLHDHNRKGEKGFYYIGPGFSTTPEGKMMRFYFESAGDRDTASKFKDSSMEWVRSLGGDPLCLVTELPLFVIEGEAEREPGVPVLYNRFKAAQGDIRESFLQGIEEPNLPEGISVRSLPVSTGVKMHLEVLEAALDSVRPARLRRGWKDT